MIADDLARMGRRSALADDAGDGTGGGDRRPW